MPIGGKEAALKQIRRELLRFVNRPWLELAVPIGRSRHQFGARHGGESSSERFAAICRTGEGNVRQGHLRHVFRRRVGHHGGTFRREVGRISGASRLENGGQIDRRIGA